MTLPLWRTVWRFLEKQKLGIKLPCKPAIPLLGIYPEKTILEKKKKKHVLQCSCLENPRDGGAWWASDYGVAQSWT